MANEIPLTPLEQINQAISDAISGPKRASGDAGEVESHSLTDLIAMRNYLSQGSGITARRGLRFSRFMPDGTVGGCGARFPWK